MARKTMWAVAGALLVLAPVASALQFDLDFMDSSADPRLTSKIYASEVITGADAEIDYETTEPTVRLRIAFLAGESGGIAEGDAIELDYAIANAVFADNVRSSAMSFSNGLSGCGVRVSSVDRGDAGDSSVQFTVVATGAACTNSSAAGIFVYFELPRLRGLTGGPVTVALTVDRPGGSGWPTPADEATTSPSTREAARSGEPCTTPSPTTICVRKVGKTLSRFAPGSDPTSAWLIRYSAGLTFSAVGGGTSTIDFADGDRTTFLNGAAGRLGSVTVGVASAAMCTGDDPFIPADCILQLDGKEFTIDRNGDGQGNLSVSVTGDFHEGDSVWLELGERGMQDREMLEMQEDGSMAGMFRLTDVAGRAAAQTGPMGDIDREQGVATRVLYYMPNGEDALRPAEFRTSYGVDFADNAVRDKPSTVPAPAVHETMYSPVIEDTQHAYAIPGIGADDIGNVRIKCEVATSCTVYLECDDSAGDSWFAELGAPIEGRATHVVRSSDIGEMLGVGEDGWEGMLSCNVLSTRRISVQLLTRAAGVLVNNTYIERDE